LYQQLSTTLSGSQEFTALEKLYSNYESKDFDLIILDTPPTKHAIDFLNAPQKLSVLFNEGVAKWFRRSKGSKGGASIFANIMHAGTLQVLKILENLTGSEFMRELADFFQNIESWQSKLEERVTAVHRLLVSPGTHFCLVTSFDQAKLKEATYFNKEIRKGGYHLSSVIINRAFPSWLADFPTDFSPQESLRLSQEFLTLRDYYRTRDLFFQNFAKELITSSQQEDIICKIPELEQDVANLSDVSVLAKIIEDGGQL
jgi:anion-transporting  ArsA/GET3 family ATPase